VDKRKGYFLLWRSLDDWPDWHLKPFSRGQAWVDMIMKTNHEPREEIVRGHLIKSERGQLVMSQSRMASRWGWARSHVQDFLKGLEMRQQIRQQKTSITSIITILNYIEAQEYRREKRQQNGSGAAAARHRSGSGHIIMKPKGNTLNSLNTLNADTPPPPSGESIKGELSPLVDLWNEERIEPLPKVSIVNDARRKKEILALKAFPHEWWREIFQKINSTPFCIGQGEGGWIANYDWALGTHSKSGTLNAIRVLEGIYDHLTGPHAKPIVTFEQQRLANTIAAGERFVEEAERGFKD
jgi:hypothetical protein